MNSKAKSALFLSLLLLVAGTALADDESETTITADFPSSGEDVGYEEYGSDDEINFDTTVDGPSGEVEIYVDEQIEGSFNHDGGSVTYDGLPAIVSSSGSHEWSIRYNGDDGSTKLEGPIDFTKLTYFESAEQRSYNEIVSPNQDEEFNDEPSYLNTNIDVPPGDIEFVVSGNSKDTFSHSGGRSSYNYVETLPPGEYFFDVLYSGNDGSSGQLMSLNYFYQDTTPSAEFSYSPSGPNVGEFIDFSEEATDDEGDIDTYNWAFGDGSTSSEANPTHTYTSGGSYTVSLEVVDSNGLSAFHQETISVNSPPSADFDYARDTPPANNQPHANEQINFYDDSSDSDGDIQSIEWSFPDGSTPTGDIVNYEFDSSGTYDVSLTATDNDGSTDTYTNTISVDPENQDPNSDFDYNPENPVVSQEVQFSDLSSDSDGSVTSWDWTFGDGTFSNSQNPTHTYDSSGTYTVELTVEDNDGYFNSYSETVTVEENSAPSAEFSYLPSEPIEGDTVDFTDESTDADDNIESYSWDFGDGSSSNIQNPSNTYDDAGSYTVELTVEDAAGASDTYTQTVEVDPLRPAITGAEYILNNKTGRSDVVLSLDENGNQNLESFSGPGILNEFTNSTLSVSVDRPITGDYKVTNFGGVDSNIWNTDLDIAVSPLRPHSYSHSLINQRVNKSYVLTNNGDDPVTANVTMKNHGTVVSGETGSVSLNPSEQKVRTGIWEDDSIINEVESVRKRGQRNSSTSTLSTQYIYEQLELSAENQRDFRFEDVDISSICSATSSTDVPSGQSVIEPACNYNNNSADYITDVQYIDLRQGQDMRKVSTPSTQYIADQTGLEANNTLDFTLPEVDISNKCEDVSTASVNPGFDNITENCNVTETQGDWISNVQTYGNTYSSGTVVYGAGVKENFTASQSVYAENNNSNYEFKIDFSSKLSSQAECQVGNPNATLSPITGTNSSFSKSCDPGKQLSYTPVQKTSEGDLTKYVFRADYEVFSNVTDEVQQSILVNKSRLDDFSNRNADSLKASVDGKSSGLQVGQDVVNGKEYVEVVVPDNFGNSSLHEGEHDLTLNYTTGSSDDGGSGGGGFFGGGGSGGDEDSSEQGNAVAWSHTTMSSAAGTVDTNEYLVIENYRNTVNSVNITLPSNGQCQYFQIQSFAHGPKNLVDSSWSKTGEYYVPASSSGLSSAFDDLSIDVRVEMPEESNIPENGVSCTPEVEVETGDYDDLILTAEKQTSLVSELGDSLSGLGFAFPSVSLGGATGSSIFSIIFLILSGGALIYVSGIWKRYL